MVNNDDLNEIINDDFIIDDNSIIKNVNPVDNLTDKLKKTTISKNNDIFDELDSDNDNDSLDLTLTTSNEKLKNKLFFLKLKDFPVNYCFMEKMDKTLDDLLDDYYDMSEEEWLSILFQITFGLAVSNKKYNFVHNDLHSSNIMFKKTKLKFIYFNVNGTFFKIPTFNKITKIIDFARSTLKFENEWIFSDVFSEDGEAEGQYTYPSNFKNLKKCEFKPNPSFDLVRLATTIIERLEEGSKIYELVKKWCISDDGSNMLEKEDDFDLYIDIAHNCHNADPKSVLRDSVFNIFKINKNQIPKRNYIYVY